MKVIQPTDYPRKRSKEDFWDEGGDQEYDDAPTTRRNRTQMMEINAWLRDADITFDDPTPRCAENGQEPVAQDCQRAGARHREVCRATERVVG